MLYTLTEREKEILQALAYGERLKAYAFRIHRHPQSIKNRMTIINRKLNAYNHTHAVAIAMRLGFIH